MQTRRDFIEQITIAAGLGLTAGLGCTAIEEPKAPRKVTTIRRLKKPVAIAMWDFSWLLRQHRNGGFEDWNRAVGELAERGYDSVRIDVFPHLVSQAAQSFTFTGRPDGSHALWGNDVEVTVRPREALLEFLPLCYKHGLSVDLSTWYQGPAGTSDQIRSFDAFVRTWQDTIEFLERNDLMRNVLFIDLLNEFPLWNGFGWLREAAKSAAREQQVNAPRAGEEHLQQGPKGAMSRAETNFYQDFCGRLLAHFRHWRPQYDFCTSLTANTNNFQPEACVDLSAMDVIDVHLWYTVKPELRRFEMGGAQSLNEEEVRELYAELKRTWHSDRETITRWMTERMDSYASWRDHFGGVLGNTEGWGAVGWDDVPGLDWAFIKEASEICVELARSRRYMFICTSNFTHPHFRRLWQDVTWHRQLTARIRERY